MEGLGAAASVIAVVDISKDVVLLCYQYAKAVKNAESDIRRLQVELERLITILGDVQALLEGQKGDRLKTSQGVGDALPGCRSQLEELRHKLKEKLIVRKRDKLRSSFGRAALKWPFESKDVDDFLRNLTGYRDMLSVALQVDQTFLLLDHFERLHDDERLNILEWISPIPHNKHHNTIKEARTMGTCEWLLHHEKFREWEDPGSSAILWLQGSPGAGKSFLTSKVIDYVSTLLNSNAEEGFAFFYCNRNEEERRNPLSILRSLVRQLSTTPCKRELIRTRLRHIRQEMREKGSDLTLAMCKEQLLESVDLFPKTTLVLDALDECQPDSRAELIEILETLSSSRNQPVKIFISSRPDRDIRARFIDRVTLEISATHNENDIRKYVNDEIVKHEKWTLMSQALQNDILRVLLERSEGMFQWISLQIKQILELESEAAIRDRLGKLPRGLKAAYDEIYATVQARHKEDRAFADRAIKWVMCACTPLNSEELLSAIRLESGSNSADLSEGITESQLLHLCNNLLVLDSQRSVWRFSHLSVTEYFEDKHWDLKTAHCHAAQVCLKLLIGVRKDQRNETEEPPESSGDEHSDLSTMYDLADVFDPEHPLQLYSKYYWVNHVQTQEDQSVDPTLANLLKEFLGSPQESSVHYQQWHRRIGYCWERPISSVLYGAETAEISPKESAIFTMCRFAIYTPLADWWSDTEITLPGMNANGSHLLALAAIAGSKPICKALVRRGIEINSPDRYYGSALAAAVAETPTSLVKPWKEQETYLDHVRFLVQECKAEVNAVLQYGGFGSALAAAASLGETETVKFLVQEGKAEVNMVLPYSAYGSALAAAAAYNGDTKTVKFLVREGKAEVNAVLQYGGFGSALAAAASLGETETVKFLVQEGKAEVNAVLQTGYHGSALAAAAYWGWTQCVQYLIEAGARTDLRLKHGSYHTALEAAQADISEDDLNRMWHGRRDDKTRSRDKVLTAELLQGNRIISKDL